MSERKFEERWEHFRDLVEHLFLEPGRGSAEADVIWYPATDAYETEDAFVVRMDLSGVDKEEIQILMKDGVLYVRGIRRDRSPKCRKTFHKMEVAMGPFARSIQIAERFAGGEAEAAYRDGILEIRLAPRTGASRVDTSIEVGEGRGSN